MYDPVRGSERRYVTLDFDESLMKLRQGALLVLLVVLWPPPALPQATEEPRFVDVTARSGVDFVHETGAFGEKWLPETMGSGVLVFDADGDRRDDLLFLNGSHFPGRPESASRQALYLNRGGWRFEPGRDRGLDVAAYCLGGAAGDLDNDGDADVLLTCLGQDRLFENLGDRFVEVSRRAGLSEAYEFGAGAALFDADRDGLLDLFVTRYVEWTPETDLFCSRNGVDKAYCTPEGYSGVSPRFYKNRGDWKFEDWTRRAGLYQPDAKALGVTVLDVEGDGWPDLAVACDTSRHLLYRNQGNGAFTEIGLLAGMALSASGETRGGMGIDGADFDHSGRASLLISHFAHEMVGLYSNQGDRLFVDVAAGAGVGPPTLSTLGWGTFFFDFDLDGWLDVLVANGHLEAEIEETSPRERHAQPTQLFRNTGAGRFADVTATIGGDLATPRVARGAAYGDFDDDGDLDVVMTVNGGPARLFENRGGGHGNWLRVRLAGVASQRQGIGARVEVVAGDLEQTWLVRTGGSYLSQSQLEPVFGLGGARRVDRIVVRWPSGAVQTVTDVAVNQRLEIREAAAAGAASGEAEGRPTAATGAPPAAAPAHEVPPPAADSEVAAEHYNRALAHLAENRFDEAAAAFEAALAAHPAATSRDLDAAPGALVYDVALSLLRARRFEEALARLAALPESPRSLVLAARALRALHRHDEAFAAWEKARQAQGLDVASLWHLAQLLQLDGRSAQAAEVLTELLHRVGPGAGAGTVVTERAEALAAVRQWQGAFESLDRAVEALAPADAEVASLVEEARAALAAEDFDESAVLISIACNLLRSSAAYQEAARGFLERGPESPLSDEPLPLPIVAAAGEARGPLERLATLPAAAARGLCEAGGDLVVVGERDSRRYTRGPEGEWAVSASWPYAAFECGMADLDQDGAGELVLLDGEGVLVAWPDGATSRLASGPVSGMTFFDHDLDGDADLLTVAPDRVALWRNNRDRSFTDVSSSSGLAGAAGEGVLGAIATDLVGDGAAELYLSRPAAPNLLLTGLRQETVRQLDMGLASAAGAASFADLDHDRDLDLITAGRLFLNRGATWDAVELPLARDAARLGTADLDADGFLDLLVLESAGRLRVLRGLGGSRFEDWPGGAVHEGVRDLVAADFDRDGRLELALLRQDRVDFLAATGAGHSLVVALTGTKDNTDALGSRLDLWAGRLRLHRELRHGTFELGETGPRRLLGLGDRTAGQWLRVVWPNRTWASREEPERGGVALEQSPDLVGSCPFLYAWDGERFAFVTDLLGGAPLGLPLARGVHMPIDPDELVLLPPGLLAEKDGAYELRIAVELREMLFLDHVALIAVDRPAGVAIATDDGLRPPPFPTFHVYAGELPRAPVAAVDHRGVDVLDRLLEVDGRYPDGFAWSAFQGYAEPHALTVDFGELASVERPFLIVTGGYYWSEADNLALAQSTRLRARPPVLEAWDGAAWRTVLDPMPFPGGRPKTLAIDLTGRLRPGDLRLRIRSNLRLYFDQVLLADDKLPRSSLRLERLAPASAELAWRGYSSRGEFDGRVPPPYDYERRLAARPYPAIEGFYTRYGDVLPLLESADDASAILHHGDEVVVRFPLPGHGPPPGWQRDFLFYSAGWDKDGDPNVETGATVAPLPFRGMSEYPYSAPEHYPWTPELRELERRFQTRWICGR